MKFAFLVMLELRSLKKTINNLYKYIIDYYNADVFVLCQESNNINDINLFNKNVVYKNSYKKPNVYEDLNITNNNLANNWNNENCLQCYINWYKMYELLNSQFENYDYYIILRTDIDILFPFPPKNIFENIPNKIYTFDANYAKEWGGYSSGVFVHKNYILDYLKCFYDIIKNNLYDDFLSYQIQNQENYMLFSMNKYNLSFNYINNLNIYFTAEDLNDHTTWSTIKYSYKYNVICKYENQCEEAHNNLLYWNNGANWVFENNILKLKKNNNLIENNWFNNNSIIINNNIKIIKNKIFENNNYYYNNKLFNNNIQDINIYDNILLESKKNNEITNYNYDHLIININNSIPNINIYNNFLKSNSNKSIDFSNNYLIIDNGVFFNSITSYHHSMEHLIFDFMSHINIFYDLLSLNNDYTIIFEIIPFQKYDNKFNIYDNLNYDINIINEFIKFIKKLGLKNEIKIISPISIYQNFDNDFIFIKKLHTIKFVEIDNINYLPLLTKISKNLNNNYISTTLINILNINSNYKNIHYEYHNKKFFILEKPNKLVNITNDLFSLIYIKCHLYCCNNNLKLVIYDEEYKNKEDIYERYNISSNADIIIGFSQTFFLYNYTISNGKILILNQIYEENENELLQNINIYNYYQYFQNNNIILLHYFDENNNNLIDTVDNFLL